MIYTVLSTDDGYIVADHVHAKSTEAAMLIAGLYRPEADIVACLDGWLREGHGVAYPGEMIGGVDGLIGLADDGNRPEMLQVLRDLVFNSGFEIRNEGHLFYWAGRGWVEDGPDEATELDAIKGCIFANDLEWTPNDDGTLGAPDPDTEKPGSDIK